MNTHAAFSDIETFSKELTIMTEKKLLGLSLSEDQAKKYSIISIMVAAYYRLLDLDISKLKLQDVYNLDLNSPTNNNNITTSNITKKVKQVKQYKQTDEEKEAVRKSIQTHLTHYQTIRMNKWIRVKDESEFEIELPDVNLLDQQ